MGVSTYYGLATPPTSYGGYGGNDPNASPKYKFEYPTGWKSDVINKTDKGTQGIDCRLYNPKNKLQQVFVITFGRAGEDNKSFKLTDIDSTIAGFAGADYDMQDALSMGEKKTSQREVNGQLFFDIEIESPDAQYLSTVTVMQGKVYACFVKSPARVRPSSSPPFSLLHPPPIPHHPPHRPPPCSCSQQRSPSCATSSPPSAPLRRTR